MGFVSDYRAGIEVYLYRSSQGPSFFPATFNFSKYLGLKFIT
jgi:hypothetical protein